MRRMMLLLLPLLLSQALPVFAAAEPFENEINGFIKTEGAMLMDGNNLSFYTKGIAFGNDVWANPSRPPKTHHTEDSYRELSELGFNSIRFYINYGLFEKDNDPYNYDFKGVEGWDWLDWNIEMAKKYNIRLVLNMHYPQGGYQSLSDGMALWTDKKNRDRLTALWTEIAKRYKDEPAIMGFDILNEPVVPDKGSIELSFAQWQDLAQEIAYSIRTVNENHIIFVERLNAIYNPKTGSSNWSENMNGQMNFFLIDDPNVVYEFHFYGPGTFTHQNASWVPSYRGIFASYPDENAIEASGMSGWMGAVFDNPKMNRSGSDWQELKGVKYKVNDKRFKIGIPTVQTQNLGAEGAVYIDDITVNEYDASGRFVRQIRAYDFSNESAWGFWSEKNTGEAAYEKNEGRKEKGSLVVSGTTGDANVGDSTGKFPVKQGYQYEISGWLKGKALDANANVTFRVDFYDAEEILPLNKAYLEKSITQYIAFGQENDVPLYLGEFGVIADGFKDSRGGEHWVKDVLDICKENNIHFNYHTYHETAFGLYLNSASAYPAQLNTSLFNTFKEALRDYRLAAW